MGAGVTMNAVVDRIPGNPGRVMVMPEDGSASYYATITMADNPIEPGTPINKALFDSIEVDVPDGSIYFSGTVGTNAYTATIADYTEYVVGQQINGLFTNANTGASTLNINELGAKNITRNGGVAILGGDIAAGSAHVVEYDGTNFQLMSQGASLTALQLATPLTGYALGSNAALTASDALLGSLGKIQAQLNARLTTTNGGVGTFKRIQKGQYASYGNVPITAGTDAIVTSSISAVSDISKTIVTAYGYIENPTIIPVSPYMAGDIFNAQVTNSTTLTFTIHPGGTPDTSKNYNIMVINWTVLEFY